ncbi:AHH domain-containing protein [Corallococcus sp. bb12-1]|uniref:AHH domain-containing protein n=1 Tax=Corallococcus sp. bb12-1 TaxID=2996784 RepID=UPI002271EFB2|nr:AHH domain-containing protein [Corallococcus sp. bb12-1]MCY1045293.1 AHH domain-containing protein [Corallococcus sp. bb12-1]
MGDDGHLADVELEDLHKQHRQKSTTEGGACLTGHEASFRKKQNKVTCNYRYQAYEQAGAEAKIKERLHDYASRTTPVKTSVYETNAGGWAPAYYALELPAPAQGDWDVGGPSKSVMRKSIHGLMIKIPAGMNFSQDTWPYWNNAHHLIPKGLFNTLISEQLKNVPNVMRKSLMMAKYNINHKLNMFMLPQDKEVARILGLTRHIQLKHGGEGVDEICTDHPVYNRHVRNTLTGIIRTYKSLCDKAKQEGHELPETELIKKKLENLSKNLMNQIIAWGQSEPGASLDKHANKLQPQAKNKSDTL